jgi:hypothetical protein
MNLILKYNVRGCITVILWGFEHSKRIRIEGSMKHLHKFSLRKGPFCSLCFEKKKKHLHKFLVAATFTIDRLNGIHLLKKISRVICLCDVFFGDLRSTVFKFDTTLDLLIVVGLFWGGITVSNLLYALNVNGGSKSSHFYLSEKQNSIVQFSAH